MVDEAHERSLSTDILLGILKKIRKRRPELRIVVSSATLQAEDFLRFFAGNAVESVSDQSEIGGNIGRIVNLEGRTFPVDILYLEEPAPDYVEAAVKTVFDIHTKVRGGGAVREPLLMVAGRRRRCIALSDRARRDRSGNRNDLRTRHYVASSGSINTSTAPICRIIKRTTAIRV